MRSEGRLTALLDRLQASDPSRVEVWRAPGRVNIIGEHVDYLGGLVLPFACDLEVLLACVPEAGRVRLSSLEEAGDVDVPLSGGTASGWGRYAAGVLAALGEAGVDVRGIRGALTSTVPVGAGLSSSAALEAAVALAVTSGARVPPELLQRAEHLAVGVPCGIMDPVAVLEGHAGTAMLLDCSTGRFERIALPSELGFVVADTGTRRQLADGCYARRRDEVESALEACGGGLDGVDLAAAERSFEEVPFHRLRHAVTEHRRVREAVEALRAGDLVSLGRLLGESHRSLRDDFEVSSDALDAAVTAAASQPGCFGSRLIGAGFAGCVLAIVRTGAEDDVARSIEAQLPGCRAFAVQSVDGAGPALGSE